MEGSAVTVALADRGARRHALERDGHRRPDQPRGGERPRRPRAACARRRCVRRHAGARSRRLGARTPRRVAATRRRRAVGGSAARASHACRAREVVGVVGVARRRRRRPAGAPARRRRPSSIAGDEQCGGRDGPERARTHGAGAMVDGPLELAATKLARRATAGQGLEPQLPEPESGVLPITPPGNGRRAV